MHTLWTVCKILFDNRFGGSYSSGMDSDDLPTKTPRKASIYARPDSSKRVVFSLGLRAQEQSDIIARIASNYGYTSRSALIRGLLQFAEDIAVSSGDQAVRTTLELSNPKKYSRLPGLVDPDPVAHEIWARMLKAILAHSDFSTSSADGDPDEG